MDPEISFSIIEGKSTFYFIPSLEFWNKNSKNQCLWLRVRDEYGLVFSSLVKVTNSIIDWNNSGIHEEHEKYIPLHIRKQAQVKVDKYFQLKAFW